jgi:hypothetical protein
MGYWIMLPYSSVRHYPNLKLAPVGVVPQRNRQPRPIMDYTYNYVNQHFVPLAPLPAMQFGHALQRFLQHLVYANPKIGLPLLAKIDLADGYYRVPLSPSATLHLAVVLPPDHTGQTSSASYSVCLWGGLKAPPSSVRLQKRVRMFPTLTIASKRPGHYTTLNTKHKQLLLLT